MKPTLFIGSSVESIRIAKAVQAELKDDVDSMVWDQGIFLSQNTLDSLLNAAHSHDYGVFILAPEDIALIRKQRKSITRDNVMFELGMFFGALGKEYCFFLVPEDNKDFRIPTDLAGITAATYDLSHSGGLRSALGPACEQIREAILSSKSEGNSLAGEWTQKWSVEIDGELRDFESRCVVSQIKRRVKAKFESLGRTYGIEGTIERENIVTGIWRDLEAGATYFGSFQLVISPLKNSMKGKWVGWSQQGVVRSGDWVWERIPKTAAKSSKRRAV